jgi:hypothetical protein
MRWPGLRHGHVRGGDPNDDSGAAGTGITQTAESSRWEADCATFVTTSIGSADGSAAAGVERCIAASRGSALPPGPIMRAGIAAAVAVVGRWGHVDDTEEPHETPPHHAHQGRVGTAQEAAARGMGPGGHYNGLNGICPRMPPRCSSRRSPPAAGTGDTTDVWGLTEVQ